MSGKPYPEGVDEVVALLDKQAALEFEIADLAPKVTRHHDALRELSEAQHRTGELLKFMDLEHQGNAGFGSRMRWFLLEMRRRLLQEDGKR